MNEATHSSDVGRSTQWLRGALGLGGSDMPFPWQSELLRRFLRGEAVGAVDVPTGLGKTGVMAVWLVARALGAALPRRLVYVVDRRVVVDQATVVAESLRAWVSQERPVADALGLGVRPLPISTLRGQHVDNRAWLEDPSSPAIVVGTVDMIGSRLLFEGYGVSRRMRPYHAGLLGADALVVLDEAHLVPPFERLVEAIERGIQPGGSLGPRTSAAGQVPRMSLLSLSATGRQWQAPLTLSDADRAHPVVAQRLSARKILTVREPVHRKELAQRLADAAWSLSHGKPIRCVVYATSRDVAQDVCDRLRHHDGTAVELLVGARRVYERTGVAGWLVEHGFVESAAGQRAAPSNPGFLVATSAGEVGVDMDADHMVSDLVPWERMVQRLGRVNRRGEGDAQVIVLPENGAKDAERLERTQTLLLRLPQVNGGHDASPWALSQLRASVGAEIEQASSPAPLHPPLARAQVESWSMTSLEDHTGRPAVQPWIRGWVEEQEPQTAVLFRRELPLDNRGARLSERATAAYLEAAPPHLKEVLETETWRVVEWLDTRRVSIAKTRNPEPIVPGDDVIVGLVLDSAAVVREVRLSDLESKRDRERLARDLGGATLLLDVRVGGLRHGLLDSEHAEASDVGEQRDGATPPLPFRISRVGGDAPAATTEGLQYREEARLCVAEAEGAETAWLVVETLAGESAESEEGRAVTPTRAQLLEEHREWTAREARSLAARLGLAEPYASMVALAASLHDEGKRARTWQRAFGVKDAESQSGRVYAKTPTRPNLGLLSGYRHELGSLRHAERDPRVQSLSPELRDLCLHLIAAHHGFARPLLRTDGAEEPPSVLVGRAQQIALRFARLEKTWGPWGLAWWEALIRAADQRASRFNDEGGAHG